MSDFLFASLDDLGSTLKEKNFLLEEQILFCKRSPLRRCKSKMDRVSPPECISLHLKITELIFYICRRQIRNALNQQTAIQFKQYAEQQFPGNSQQVKYP